MIPQPIPLAAPRPGYAAPVSALMPPNPAATPEGRMPASPEMSEFPHAGGMPNSPHPLQPPMVPIAPVFARPSTATSRDVKFESKPIMRGDGEDTVLPRRGNRGDDFWRRFSMVVKEDMAAPPGQKQRCDFYRLLPCPKLTVIFASMWLKKTQNGTTRMSRWVWVIGMTLLIVRIYPRFSWQILNLSLCRSLQAPSVWGGGSHTTALSTPLSRPLVEVREKRPPLLLPLSDRKSTRLNSSHSGESRMPSSA